jgi:hypothetical protein
VQDGLVELACDEGRATSLKLEGRLGEVARARLLGRVVGPQAERHRSGRKR